MENLTPFERVYCLVMAVKQQAVGGAEMSHISRDFILWSRDMQSTDMSWLLSLQGTEVFEFCIALCRDLFPIANENKYEDKQIAAILSVGGAFRLADRFKAYHPHPNVKYDN